MESKIITKIEFNLTCGDDVRQIKGEATFYPDRAVIVCDGEERTVGLSALVKLRARRGVGSVTLEAVLKDDTVILCRGSMDFYDNFSLCARRVNKFISLDIIDDNSMDYPLKICPKCGRPVPIGSKDCPRCRKKGEYFGRLWQIAKPFRGYVYLSLLFFFAVTAFNLLLPKLNQILIDDYIKADALPDVWQYVLMILGIIGVNLVSRLISMGRGVTQTFAASKVIVKLRNMTFEKIANLSLGHISKRTSGELMNRVTEDTNRIQRFITNDIANAAEEILMLLGVGTLLFIYDWRLALLILLPVPLVICAHRLMWNFLRRHYGRQWYVGANANTVLHDIFSGIRVVKSFGMEDYEKKRYDEVISDERKTRADNETYFALINPVVQFLMGIGEFFLLYYVGNKILGNEMTIGQMQQFMAYATMIYGPLRWIANLPRMLTVTMTSVAKVFDVIDEESDVEDKPDAVDIENVKGHIEIENLNFGYETKPEVLENINLDIKPGEFIGLVGRSGVGKSTLINLIMRMYDPDEGSIKIDGTDIRDVTQSSLRSNMGVVLQETMLFSGSLYRNIAYSKPDATPEEVINAAKIAGVHKFAVKLPDGYNTVIGEKGYTLSGGERQRVSIARAVLHNPKILILDEATSSLDTETERDVQEALKKLTEGRTTIAIAHRLSTLRNATRLVVLDKGTVAETGTHDELMRRRGLYYELVMAQRQMSKMTK